MRFAASSLASFAVDYGTYTLLVLLTRGWNPLSVPLSNVGARILSAALNFTLNRRFVFHNQGRLAPAMLKYAALAGCVLACNTLLLSTLVQRLGMNSLLAKLFAEGLLFLISWFVQKTHIFCTGQRQTASGY